MKLESEWPPSDLPDEKTLYNEFYDHIHQSTKNIVCASCGCIGHDESKYYKELITSDILKSLVVDPCLVPFDFGSRNEDLKRENIMIDDLGILEDGSEGPKVVLCSTCHHSLTINKEKPLDSLANYRWIGKVPEELQGLSWIEESLISRAHLIGKIVRLQNRNATSYFAIKGHMVLVPQDTRKLVDLLPGSPDSLLDSIRVVWVGKDEPDKSHLHKYFTVKTERVRKALEWLCHHNEDYHEVQIDEDELQRWPSVFVAEKLMNSMARIRRAPSEDASRSGYGVEDMDILGLDGDLPISASALIDTNGVSESSVVSTLQGLAQLKESEKIVNVVTGKDLLSDYEMDYYFTAAFPVLFPYGTGKHIHSDRPKQLSLSRWIQLMLRHSSRYYLQDICFCLLANDLYRRFQAHDAFVALAFDIVRRRRNSSKASLQTRSHDWEATEKVLTSLTADQLMASAQQVQSHQKIMDPGSITLLNAVNRMGVTSSGSDEKRSHMLTQLKSSMVHYGCPVIFLTLNPGERHSPISLYYAGENIDLKTFDPELWSASERLRVMMHNPLAVIEYFHKMVREILEGPLSKGLFGEMQHYYGTIEYQGRGTPHIHLAV